ncbi:MAG TPA: hypothetical protein VKU01_01670 [Bryobacteraceae bacterium]|nr:hypothetical protein [Bryobacteraceae bacterium]
MPTVGDGDCILSIADAYGFRDYHTIWDFGANSGLKGTRPNANTLLFGDMVVPPDAKAKTIQKPTDNTHVLVVKNKKPAKLTLILIDKDGNPLKDKVWTLTAPTALNGTTGPDGKIEVPNLDVQATAGALKVTMWKAPDPKPPVPAKTLPDPVPYPPPILVEEFKDKKPDPTKPEDYDVNWTLKIGSLPTYNDATGVQARLNNLGFRCKPKDDATKTTQAVKVYQNSMLNQKDGTGATADIQDDIRNRHENP